MSLGSSGGAAGIAARMGVGLMEEGARTGLPALRGATNFASDSLKRGLPAYAKRAYSSAAGSALEQAIQANQQARVQALTGRGVNAATIGSYQGAARQLAKEQAGIAVSKAMAGVSHRNQMMNVLTGGAATTTQLGTSFGALTNRGLQAGLGAGDPAYEGVVGGTAAVAPLLLTMLQKPPYATQSQLTSYAGNQASRGQLLFPMP